MKKRKWLYEQADWAAYERMTTLSIRPGIVLDVSEFTERIIEAATACIPRTSGKVGSKAVPWWCPEVKTALKQRRKRLRALRRMDATDPRKIDALKKFQEARATAKLVIRNARNKSWENFISDLSPSSTSSELWRKINALRGKRQLGATVIKMADDSYTNKPEEVAEILAKHYTERSATHNYPSSFQTIKERVECNPFLPSPDNDDVYNTDFTLDELAWALDKGRSVSTGPDNVGYNMLQQLSMSAKAALLDLLNRVWRSGVFPPSWRVGIVVPILKPHTTDGGPERYRPITLTSCVAKLFERMVNRRLITELENNGRLDRRQHAFRSGHGTDSYFAELERILPNAHEHCLIASLDLAKAYDTTWRYAVLRTLNRWHIQGRMFNIINSFLSERFFQVCIGSYLSQPYPLENGIPQGSVLSVTLFLVAIQPVFQVIPVGADILVYADDILLAVRGCKNKGLYRKLQSAVNAVVKWSNNVGFSISVKKSSIFYCSPNTRREPARNISINRTPVPKANTLKILGVTIDRTLRFKTHCRTVKAACETRTKILKIIGARIKRGHRTVLNQIGFAIVTSHLLYGIGLVSRGGQTIIDMLSPTYNRTIRYASGAFVTSPISAIMAESGILPFHLLVLQHIVRISIRLLAYDRRNADLPLILRSSKMYRDTCSRGIPTICNLQRHSERQWNKPELSILWDIKTQVSAGDPASKVIPIVLEMLETRFRRCVIVYTDGSKLNETVGAGIYDEQNAKAIGLPKECSVFSAEAFALKIAVSTYRDVNDLVIMSDSASCLSALETGKSKHAWIQEIENLAYGRTIHFCWIPGHAGICGNIHADRLANEGRINTPIEVPIPAEDALKEVKTQIRKHWNNKWFAEREAKLREIKFDTTKWVDRTNPGEQRTLTRLRIGHTRLTHSFLLERNAQPICECCGTILDVRHIILNCRKFDEQRRKYRISNTSLREALCNEREIETKLIAYLKDTKLLEQI